MNHLDLFSGIGGFSLAASWVWGEEHNIVLFVEIDKFCQKVLKKHWPDVPVHDDIRTLDYEKVMAYAKQPRQIRGAKIHLLTGGFPCQPYSVAGKQRGAEDDRALWPQMLRVIRECQPSWVIGENVAGIINMELDTVLSDLENEDYTTEPFIIPACAVDAPHRRDRVWVVAHSRSSERRQKHTTRSNYKREYDSNQLQERQEISSGVEGSSQDVADTENTNRRGSDGKKNTGRWNSQTGRQGESSRGIQDWLPEPNVGRVVARLSRWLDEPDIPRVATGVPDRINRLKSLGNSIVPQVVVPIMQAIKNGTKTSPTNH